jgi:hypothetical protein
VRGGAYRYIVSPRYHRRSDAVLAPDNTDSTRLEEVPVFKKTLVIAAPVVASAALVAGGLGASSMQANASDSNHPPTMTSNKASDTTTCDGGVQKHTWNRGVSGYIQTVSGSGSTIMPNSIIRLHGPSSGRDVLSVNLSAEAYVDSGSQGRVKVLLDGVPMAPSDLNAGSLYDDSGFGNFGQNYCRNIGPGGHSLRVVISDFSSTAGFSFYLHDPMVHVEQSE